MKLAARLVPTFIVLGGPVILAVSMRGHWLAIFLAGIAVGTAYVALTLSPRGAEPQPDRRGANLQRMLLPLAAVGAVCEAIMLWIAFAEVDLDRLSSYRASQMVFLPGLLLPVIGLLAWRGRSSSAKA